MNRSLLSGVFSVISSKVVIMLIGLVTTPILYRLLEPSGFGDYSFLQSVFAIFMIFVSSGITDGVRKFVAEERDLPDWEAHVVSYYFRLAVVFAVVGAVALSIAAREGLVAAIWGAEFTPYFYVLAGLVITAQFRAYARKTLMGFGLERYSEPLNALDTAAFAVFAILLVYLGYGVIGALVGLMLSSLLVALIGLFLVQRRVPLSYIVRRPPARFPRRTMFTFNSLSIVLVLFLSSLYHIDVVMLQTFRESSEVGNYKAALTLAEFLWFVPLALQTVYVHSMSELWSRNEIDRISTIASQTTRYTFLLTAVMAVGLAALADAVVPLYFGVEATPAVEPLLLLLPGALGFALARPILAISQGKGQLRYPIVATGTAAVINLVLNVLLIPDYGMAGAAIATSTGYGSMFVFHCLSARQVGFYPLSDARLGRVALTAVLAAVPIFLLADLLSVTLAVPVVGAVPVSLLLVPPVGFLIFAGFTLLTGAMGLGETVALFAEFPDPIGSTAMAAVDRLESIDIRSMSGSSLQLLLIGGGVLLLVVGLAFTLIGPGIGDSPAANSGDDPAPETEVPADTEAEESTGAVGSTGGNGTGAEPAAPDDASTGETPVESGSPTEDGEVLPEEADREEVPLEPESEATDADDPEPETETGTQDDTGSGAGTVESADSPTETEESTESEPSTLSPTETETETDTETATETESPTETTTETETEIDTPIETDTETDTPTETETETDTPTETETETDTETATETESPTETTTETETEIDTPIETETETDTPTETETETDTPTETETETDTPTETETETDTPTETETETDTPTETDTETDTPTETDTETDTPTETATETETPNETDAPNDTETETDTPTATETESPTETTTETETDTETPNETETETDTPTETPNETDTPNGTETETDTPTATETQSPTDTETATETETPNENGTATSSEPGTRNEEPTETGPSETDEPTAAPSVDSPSNETPTENGTAADGT